ncbi:MAG: trehalose-phosphatase [Vicinamibacteraceae bacterium]|nr:trehalose-phosphatase [Vicinamibacteraceae bacterium]
MTHAAPQSVPPLRAPGQIVSAVVRGTRGPRLLLFDYDGTLCDFAPAPDRAFISRDVRRLLARLGERPNVTVGIVSGRELDDVRTRVGLGAPLVYAGLHGMQIEADEVTFEHPLIAESEALMQEFVDELIEAVKDVPGVIVEPKTAAVTLHWRQADAEGTVRARTALDKLTAPLVADGRVRLLPGSAICEVLPTIPWNKGDAVDWLREFVGEREGLPPWTLFVGDDLTDENAFRALQGSGLTVLVGERRSLAQGRLDSPADVHELLRQLVEAPTLEHS